MLLSQSLSHLPQTHSIATFLNSSKSFSNIRSILGLHSTLTNWVQKASADEEQISEANANRRAERMSSMTALAPFVDPHFHIWDMSEGRCHDPEILGPEMSSNYFQFRLKDLENVLTMNYESNQQALPPRRNIQLDFRGGIHIEAIARDFDGVKEAKWVREQISDHQQQSQNKYYVSGYLNFVHPDKNRDELVEDLKQMIAPPIGVCGIRQILNFEPSWPHIKHNMLEDPKWLENFSYISEKAGLKVFEVQLNPHQFEACGKNLVSKHPNINFVVNHLGCLPGKDLNRLESFQKFLTDMQNHLAVYPNVFIKLSMMEYSFESQDAERTKQVQHWIHCPRIRQLVAEVIRIFGVDRCILASNYPVSILPLYPIDTGATTTTTTTSSDNMAFTVSLWKNWVCGLLQDGIVNPSEYCKITSRNTTKIYGLQ